VIPNRLFCEHQSGQEYAVEALASALNLPGQAPRMSGSSNTALAYKHNLEAIGTRDAGKEFLDKHSISLSINGS
jgi:hypothetical protein